MRIVKIGEKDIELRASPLALVFYKQAFERDLLADVASLQSMGEVTEDDLTGLDTVLLLQLAYVMNKAAKPKANFPVFEKWLEELGSNLFGNLDWMTEVISEVTDGFFRTSEPTSGK